MIDETDTTASLPGEPPARPTPPPSQAASSLPVTPQTCSSCGSPVAGDVAARTAAPSFVYAIGRIEARFPNLAAEKEVAQATGRIDTAGQTDQQTLHAVLARPENRYLVRQLCWVLRVQGLETYLLAPRDAADLDLLVEAIRPASAASDIDVVIGVRGPIAPPEVCNGLMVPFVVFDQVYSFDREALIDAIPKPDRAKAGQFGLAAEEVFERIMQVTDNAGATDDHRALNYLAMRYPAIYARTAEQFGLGFSLSGVEVRPAFSGGHRRIVDAIFTYTNRSTDFAEKFAVRVDVTEEFPFLVTKLSPYYDRDLGGGR
jgi:hypothetical protein